MAGKSPSRAICNFLKPIRKAVACVTKTQLSYTKPTPPDNIGVLLLGTSERVTLSSSRCKLEITLLMNYKVIEAEGELGKWKVRTVSYIYSLFTDNEERISYHYHPSASPQIWFPHLHVNNNRMHFPSGRVSIEEFIRLAILEYGARPTQDWEAVLMESQRQFEKYRTWP